MKHQPTFKPSPAKRPVVQRLTPLAWALIGVVVLVVVLGIVGAAMVFGGRGSDEVWWTPTPTNTPTATPFPAEGPTPTPTAWYEGMITPTPEPTPAYPAWWTDQMTQGEDGQWWPPDEVIEMAGGHVREMMMDLLPRYFGEQVPPDLDGYQAALPTYFIGEELEKRLSALEYTRQGINDVVWIDWKDGCLVQVQEWSEDGLEATAGVTCANGDQYVLDLQGNVIEVNHFEASGLSLWRIRYDPSDGRWKVAKLLRYIPPAGEQ